MFILEIHIFTNYSDITPVLDIRNNTNKHMFTTSCAYVINEDEFAIALSSSKGVQMIYFEETSIYTCYSSI